MHTRWFGSQRGRALRDESILENIRAGAALLKSLRLDSRCLRRSWVQRAVVEATSQEHGSRDRIKLVLSCEKSHMALPQHFLFYSKHTHIILQESNDSSGRVLFVVSDAFFSDCCLHSCICIALSSFCAVVRRREKRLGWRRGLPVCGLIWSCIDRLSFHDCITGWVQVK